MPELRRPKALLLENIHPEAVETLIDRGYEVDQTKGALAEPELQERLAGVSLLGIRSKTQVSRATIESASELEAIGAFCIGTDQMDLVAASEHGIAAFNAPYSNTRSVVELAVAEIVAMARRLTEKTEQMHRGVWDKSAVGSHEVRHRTLGIVGYGNIGSQLSVIAEALGMNVLFFDTADKLALGNARRCTTLDELLTKSDIVSLHVDGRRSNNMFFGGEQFARMKPGALFLNLCRGFVIDHEALAEQLTNGHIGGAAIDVFVEEPAGKTTEFESVLRGLPNVILTPHIGGSTEEAQSDIGRFVSRKLLDYATQGSTSLSVNLPELVPAFAESKQRITYLHHNVPGVLARINTMLGEASVNIEAQFLATRGELGYVVADLGSECTDELIKNLEALDTTVRLRVI